MGTLLSKRPKIVDFSFDIKSGVLKTKLDGGLPRIRKDQIGVASSADVTWTGKIEDYEYLRAFYRSVTVNGSEPFDIYLPLTAEALTLCQDVYFIPGSFRLISKSGGIYTMGAQLVIRL